MKRILANIAYADTLDIRRYDTKDVKFNKYKPPKERAKKRKTSNRIVFTEKRDFR